MWTTTLVYPHPVNILHVIPHAIIRLLTLVFYCLPCSRRVAGQHVRSCSSRTWRQKGCKESAQGDNEGNDFSRHAHHGLLYLRVRVFPNSGGVARILSRLLSSLACSIRRHSSTPRSSVMPSCCSCHASVAVAVCLHSCCLSFLCLGIGEQLRKRFRTCVLTFISYYDVAFTFDEEFLVTSFDECRVRYMCTCLPVSF